MIREHFYTFYNAMQSEGWMTVVHIESSWTLVMMTLCSCLTYLKMRPVVPSS
jgi:hypothetical protein